MTAPTQGATMNGKKETPRTEAVSYAIASLLKQFADGHIYAADMPGFLHGATEDFRQLERESAELRERCEALEKVMQLDSLAFDKLEQYTGKQFGMPPLSATWKGAIVNAIRGRHAAIRALLHPAGKGNHEGAP